MSFFDSVKSAAAFIFGSRQPEDRLYPAFQRLAHNNRLLFSSFDSHDGALFHFLTGGIPDNFRLFALHDLPDMATIFRKDLAYFEKLRKSGQTEIKIPEGLTFTSEDRDYLTTAEEQPINRVIVGFEKREGVLHYVFTKESVSLDVVVGSFSLLIEELQRVMDSPNNPLNDPKRCCPRIDHEHMPGYFL